MKKLLLSMVLMFASLAVVNGSASAGHVFGLFTGGCCCNNCGGTITLRQYNAFSPVACGSMVFQGCVMNQPPAAGPCYGGGCSEGCADGSCASEGTPVGTPVSQLPAQNPGATFSYPAPGYGYAPPAYGYNGAAYGYAPAYGYGYAPAYGYGYAPAYGYGPMMQMPQQPAVPMSASQTWNAVPVSARMQ